MVADADEFDDILSLFSINAASGVVQTASTLDHERLPSAQLRVVATDAGVPPMRSSAHLDITILDVNDNTPAFVNETCETRVSEDIEVPTIVLNPVATDADSGANGSV